jgi:hypothetical protein
VEAAANVEDVEMGGDDDDDVVVRLETSGEADSSDSAPAPADLWVGAEVIGGGGGGADDWTPEPEEYRLDRLFMVMAELWFQ